MTQDNSYSKYLTENDNFFYDEQSDKKSTFSKQDSELYNEDSAKIPGSSIRVKRVDDSDDWQVLINGEEHLLIRGSRFTAKEREYFRTPKGLMFIIDGVRQGWSSVSEFKRQLKGK